MGDALTELVLLIDAGVMAVQEAGDGPFIWIHGHNRAFSSGTARKGERLGLMTHGWDPNKGRWLWSLTDKGRAYAAANRSHP